MGWFTSSMTCEEVGIGAAEHCFQCIQKAPKGNNQHFMEYATLLIVAHRLGIQYTSLREDKIRRILSAFDAIVAKNLNMNDVGAFLETRGNQYFAMLNNHIDSINKGNIVPFLKELAFRFQQFCLGGGEEGAPTIIGDAFENMTLGVTASEMFAVSFGETRALIDKRKPT